MAMYAHTFTVGQSQEMRFGKAADSQHQVAVQEHLTPRVISGRRHPDFVLPKQSTTARTIAHAPNSILKAQETTRLIKKHIADRHTVVKAETTVPRVNRAYHQSFTFAEPTSGNINWSSANRNLFTFHQHNGVAVAKVPQPRIHIRRKPVARTHVNRPAPIFNMNAHTHAKRLAVPVYPQTTTQSTTVHRHEHDLKHLKVTEHVHIKRATIPTKRYRLHEPVSPHMRRHVTSTHRIAEHTHLNEHVNLFRHKSLAETTQVKRLSDPQKKFKLQEHETVKQTRHPHVVHHIKETPKKHVNTHILPGILHVHGDTVLFQTSGSIQHFKLTEHTQVQRGPSHIKSAIRLTATLAPSISYPMLTRRRVPVMGQVYQPTDIPGYQIQVRSDLRDYYYFFNSHGVIPSLYWGASEASSNSTNDSYNFWKTK